MSEALWGVILVAATGLHATFQLAVGLLVYPALAAVPSERWAEAHERHSRRITPVVAIVYGVVLLACAGALLATPGVATVVTAAASGAAFLVTATMAAPLHVELGRGRDPELIHRLLRVDRLRTLAALTALAAATLAAG